MKRWKISFQGCELDEADVTPLDYTVVSELADSDHWQVLEPRSSPTVLISWVIVATARGLNCPVEEAAILVNAAPMIEVMRSVVEYEPPVATSEQEPTPTESTSMTSTQRDALRKLVQARARHVANSEG